MASHNIVPWLHINNLLWLIATMPDACYMLCTALLSCPMNIMHCDVFFAICILSNLCQNTLHMSNTINTGNPLIVVVINAIIMLWCLPIKIPSIWNFESICISLVSISQTKRKAKCQIGVKLLESKHFWKHRPYCNWMGPYQKIYSYQTIKAIYGAEDADNALHVVWKQYQCVCLMQQVKKVHCH